MSKKGRPMRKKTKQLLIFLVVLVIVGAGVALLLLLPQDSGDTTSSSVASTSSTETISLIARGQEEVQSIVFDNENGSFEIVAEIDETESSDSSSSAVSVAYTVKGMEGITLLNSMLQSRVTFGYSLSATRNIGEQSELAPFGLDDPIASYTVTYTDGTSLTVNVGDSVPGNSSSNYVMLSGDENVYIASVTAVISASRNDFVSSYILSLMETDEYSNETLPTFDKIKISGRDHEEPIVIYPTEDDLPATSLLKYYSYYMSEPVEFGVTSYLTETYLTPLASLEATGYAAMNPTEEELQQFGFDDPIELRLWCSDQKVTLLIGNVEDSTAYVMFEDGNVIYEVDAEDVALATTSAFDLRDTLLLLCDITTVESFEFTDDSGKTYTIEQERTEKVSSSSAESDEEAEIEYEYAAYYEGLELQYYKKFYQSFLSAYREEEITDDVQLGDKLFSLKFNFYDEYDTDPLVVDVYENSDRRVVYQINGESMALVKSSWAEKVLADFVKLINDEEVKVT